MMSEMSGKSVVRSRAPNFTKDEQLLLVSSMEPYTRIIECKKTDATKQIDKQNAWSKVAEVYNANTKGVERTVDNLISCYRNMKSKLKKEHSEAKMLLEDPSKKEALINALEENGKDWNAISISMETSAEVCQSTFQTMQKEVKKHDFMHKRKVLGTGGGPPPPRDSEDTILKIKKFIEPQIDGLYTMYDGDADLMDQFQKTKPTEQQIHPIEMEFIDCSPVLTTSNHTGTESTSITQTYNERATSSSADFSSKTYQTPHLKKAEIPQRIDFLRKKRALELENDYEGLSSNKKKKNVGDSFYNLSQEKLQLVKLQKEMLELEIQHKRLEIEDKIKENKFKEEYRQKELELLELKIKNISE